MSDATAPKPSSTAGIGKLLVRGAAWSSLSTFVLRLGQFIISIVIARLISTQDFGVFVVASTVYLIVINVSEIGVSMALVREVDNADRIAPTISTIAIANSSLLASGLLFGAPWLADAFGAPAATNAIRVLAIPLFLAGPTAVPSALLTRDFRQGRRMIADMTNFIVSNGVLLILVSGHSGVMALAWSRVAGQAVSAIMLLWMVTPRYRPGFDRREARRLLSFGAPLAGANLAGFTVANVDFITLGRLAGPLQLGYYNLAFTITGWPASIFTSILGSVTLPALARVKGGMAELRQHVEAATGALCAAAFPITALSIVLAKPLIVIVYGHRWSPTAPILAALAIFGAAQVIIDLFNDVVAALGYTRSQLWAQLIWLGTLTPVMFFAVHVDGGRGAAIAQVAVMIGVIVPVYLFILRRVAKVPLDGLWRPVLYPFAAATVGGLASVFVTLEFSSLWMKLVLGTLTFFVVYIALLGKWLMGLKRTLAALYGKRSEAPSTYAEPEEFDDRTMEIPRIQWPVQPIPWGDTASMTVEIPRIQWPPNPPMSGSDSAALTAEIPIPRSIPTVAGKDEVW